MTACQPCADVADEEREAATGHARGCQHRGGHRVRISSAPPSSPAKLKGIRRKFNDLGGPNAVYSCDLAHLHAFSGWKCRQSLAAKFRFPN
jgi:hypothetical protein